MKPIVLSKEAKEDAIAEIKEYCRLENGEEISDFRAARLLEFILDKTGPLIYNQAIADAHRLMSEKIDDLFGLEKRFR